MNAPLRDQLIRDGYCTVPNVLSPTMLADLRRVTEELLAASSAEQAQRFRSTGSMVPTTAHPLFADLVAWPAALSALASLGYDAPCFSSGYVISKPPGGPPLFWHYDWPAWDAPDAFGPVPQQLFLMYYLVDTRRDNGCLRVIPGSHVNDNPLLDLLAEAHTPEIDAAADLTSPAFSTRPDEADVPVRAGDLVIGDSRLLHAAHANKSGRRRTVITLWYHPDVPALAEPTQAFITWMCGPPPKDWPEEQRAKLERMRARYTGPEKPLKWNRKRPRRGVSHFAGNSIP